MPNKNKSNNFEVKYINTEKLGIYFDRHPSFFKRKIRSGEFKEGIHYFRPSGSSSLIWNLPILEDWLVNGPDSPAHQRAIENWLSRLPSSQATQSKREAAPQ
jgi:hypothetical protein